VLVLAKAPRPGRVKTRLCPPCTPEQAAHVASAALRDTLDAVDRMARAARRVLVVEGLADETTVDGLLWPRPGWEVCDQRGSALGERIANAFADTAERGLASLLIGMDTPQVTGQLLSRCAAGLDRGDAVLGPARDGGWWLLALRDPAMATALRTVPTSQPDTGALTRAALVHRGAVTGRAPVLRDVDTAADARWVAARCPAGSRFATAVARHVPGATA
jgi:rSAM/selenodomain-associated transferase 1